MVMELYVKNIVIFSIIVGGFMILKIIKRILIIFAIIYIPIVCIIPLFADLRSNLGAWIIYFIYLIFLFFFLSIFKEHNYTKGKSDDTMLDITKDILKEKNKWYW